MGLFDITDPSECEIPNPDFGYVTPLQVLIGGAGKCCKSKKVDQSVCKMNECVSAMSLCFTLHNDIEDVSKQITNPKGMEKNDEGKMEGDCALAILNGVEGELCCTGGMKQLPACVRKQLGDYTSCEDSWNAAFEPRFFDKAVAIDKAFQAGGYCVSQSTASSVCSKCGTTKKGARSCCAQGGAWFNNCGKDDDEEFDHTWTEGALACKSKFAVHGVCAYWFAKVSLWYTVCPHFA